ncbi:phage tail sheath family protein [Armatimonas sp.]|uniref:phage tail sheath family protein n=1 Tax=Armatimonas sp. TaxID=1872638 RepID=UPI003750993A
MPFPENQEIAAVTTATSIVAVATAIPAFIGYTAKMPAGAMGFQRVRSLAEFVGLFGESVMPGYLFLSMRLFFANGGGTAYVYSLGSRGANSAAPFLKALLALEKQPDPTLLAFPDAVLLDSAQLQSLQLAALAHCAKVRNRFCILDVPKESSLRNIEAFRATLTGENLSYGAVYGPWVRVKERAGSALPASGAVAGIYASVDAQRGVWKAPANVSLSGIVGLTETITDQEQERLTIDSQGGKSINVLRAFSGKGILVWGSRTLAGNDNEWRYVPVRRLFLMVEESLRRDTAALVWEPNDANTWIKTKAQIERFLSGLWRQGALAGAKPEQAFFVSVGLGSTMTRQDILSGRLLINVGLAPVRPTEFIILRFSLKLQEA